MPGPHRWFEVLDDGGGKRWPQRLLLALHRWFEVLDDGGGKRWPQMLLLAPHMWFEVLDDGGDYNCLFCGGNEGLMLMPCVMRITAVVID